MNRARISCMSAAATLIALAAPKAVEACSCAPDCTQAFVPSSPLGIVPEVPKNGGIVWRMLPEALGADALPETWFALKRIEGETLVKVPFTATDLGNGTWTIRPTQGWSEGERFRLEIAVDEETTPRCGDSSRDGVHEVVVGPDLVRAPDEVTLRVSETTIRGLLSTDGQCEEEVELQPIFLAVRAPAEVYRFESSIWMETWVDGVRWQPRQHLCSNLPPGATWLSRTQDMVFGDCGQPGADAGLDPGDHEVVVKLSLPGSDWSWTSPPQFLTIECPDDEGDDGADMGHGDASVDVDSGSGGSDSGDEARQDAGTTGEGGGGCSSVGHGSPSLYASMFGLLLFARRRRRTTR